MSLMDFWKKSRTTHTHAHTHMAKHISAPGELGKNPSLSDKADETNMEGEVCTVCYAVPAAILQSHGRGNG